MLLAGPNAKTFEVQIMQYVSLLSRELCIRNYFLRLFVLDDTLKKVEDRPCVTLGSSHVFEGAGVGAAVRK
jgi:hypothetical protein